MCFNGFLYGARLNCVHGDSDRQQFSDLVFNVSLEFHLIPVDVEVRESVPDQMKLKRDIENKIRELLTIRVAVNTVQPGAIERTQDKTLLVRVRKK